MRKDDVLVELAEIKKDLPHWPDEVIKPWLRRVSLAKKTSTALSQDAEVGVKWKVQRGWRASHARTLGCLWVA